MRKNNAHSLSEKVLFLLKRASFLLVEAAMLSVWPNFLPSFCFENSRFSSDFLSWVVMPASKTTESSGPSSASSGRCLGSDSSESAVKENKASEN